jgi:NFACT protein RNA binding domain
MIQPERQPPAAQQRVSLYKSVVALLFLHSIAIFVVPVTHFVSSSSKTTVSGFSPNYRNYYYRMSLSRSSQQPFALLFHRTYIGVRNVPKSNTAATRWHTAVSRETCNRVNTELSFRMIHRRIQLNEIPAFSKGSDVFHRFRRQHRDVKLWLSTMESNRSNDTSTDNVGDESGENSQTTSSSTSSKAVPTTDSDDEGEATEKTLTSMWNVQGLKKETYRRLDRAQKKFDQLTSRIERYKPLANKTRVTSDPHLDKHVVEAELIHASKQLREIRRFEMLLLTQLRSNGRLDMVLPEQLAERALALNMTDHPPNRPPRGEPKPKGPRRMQPTRKPYRAYTSIDNIEIRVGKKAEDNDELSTNPQYRDNDDWWMHAAGCPGSHVIIRFADRKQEPPKTTIQDAAMLAAKHSKCNGNIISVSLCRARDIKKLPMSKPGMVMLLGNVRTVSVDMKASQKRLERLESTVQVN